jgi:tetratricopeptide (TPR) repeat protein
LLLGAAAQVAMAAAAMASPAAQGGTGAPADKPLATGVVLPEVPERADPSQTFALYLPSSYSPAKRWPVMYAFDPEARGRAPVELLLPIAEKRGYILLGSNSSRNGSVREALAAALALWQDSRGRFPIDPNQSYTTGFSGASRAAFVFAEECGCVQGVIAVGAGLPALAGPLKGLSYGVFMTIGQEDFNYAEMVALEQQLDGVHVPNRLRRFDGDHEWPPAEIMAEAVDWLGLKAMQQGRRVVDTALVAELRARALERAKADEQGGDLLSAYEEYRKSADDFAGLADTAEFAARATALKNSPELRKAQKQEQEDVQHQRHMVAEVERQLLSLSAGSNKPGFRLDDISPAVAQVRDEAKRAKTPREVRVSRRAVNQLLAAAYETGEGRLQNGYAPAAELYFQVAALVAPDVPAPHLELAKVYVKLGDKKRALRELELAVSKGLKHASALRDSAALAPLRGEPRFQELVARLESKQ